MQYLWMPRTVPDTQFSSGKIWFGCSSLRIYLTLCVSTRAAKCFAHSRMVPLQWYIFQLASNCSHLCQAITCNVSQTLNWPAHMKTRPHRLLVARVRWKTLRPRNHSTRLYDNFGVFHLASLSWLRTNPSHCPIQGPPSRRTYKSSLCAYSN